MIYKREEFMEENSESKKYPVKQIEALTPVDGEGKSRFIGHVSLGIQTPMGVQSVPVTFEIDSDSIQDAFKAFEGIADKEVEKAKGEIQQQLQQMRQQAQSRIVTPGQMSPDDLNRLGGQGGQKGGGGIIQM